MHGEKANPAVFRAYDIRGAYGRDFDAGFAQRLGERFAAHVDAGALVVGRDRRTSSDDLAYAVIDGAVHAGARVIDVGELSTPQFSWAVRATGADGGIMVTASHNPGSDNGFKAVDGNGQVIGGEHLRQLYDSPSPGHRSGGAVEYYDPAGGYADAVAYATDWQGGRELRVAVEAPDSILRVLRRMGPVAPDHGVAARFDADGDRVTFFDRGVPVPAEFVFLLLAERLHLSPLVLDLRFSRAVRERLDAKRVPYVLSKVGRLYISQAMRTTTAALGGETSGHLYWKEFGGLEAPEAALLRVLTILADSRYSLTDLIAPYRRYHKSDEVAVPVKDLKHADQAMQTLAARYIGCPMDRTDGLTVDCWQKAGWWCNLRPSNTEPVLRLVVEAKRKDLLERTLGEVLALVG